MTLDALPIWLLFVGAGVAVLLATEAGYRFGEWIHRRAPEEKESPVSAIASSILGLSAFILAFTFSIVADRYDARRTLVRDDANAVRIAWRRAEFLPEPDRTRSIELMRAYVDARVRFVAEAEADPEKVESVLGEVGAIERELWAIAVKQARVDMNSDVAALYLEALDEMTVVHATRVAIGIQARIPLEIWVSLLSLTLFGVAMIGYQTGIAGSRRPRVTPVLATTFAIVFAMIFALDRPNSGLLGVSQRPLLDLAQQMRAPP